MLRNGAFGSNHPEMASFLFLDGHIRNLAEHVDINTYRGMSTIAKGEIVDH